MSELGTSASNLTTAKIVFALPEDKELLAAIARVTMAHSILDHVLRLTLKTVAGVRLDEAMDATAYQGSSVLRDRVGKLAKARLRDGPVFVRLQAVLERCRRATDKRNDLTHTVTFHELDDETLKRTDGRVIKPLPSVAELEILAGELTGLARELNEARMEGFLAEALARKK
jgi:hypothetical protein